MLLSIQQRCILELVRKLGYIRRSQLHTLVNRQLSPQGMSVSRTALDAMLRQLKVCNQAIRLDDAGVSFAGAPSDPRRLEAVDVMLELSADASLDFHAGLQDPQLLRFSLDDGKLRLFTVAVMRPGRLESLVRQRMERIIWISDNGALPAGLTLPPKHFFAARQSDGTHRFYGSEEPQNTKLT